MNKCIFVGRTTRDVELRYTQSANPLAVGRTSIAVERGYGDKKKTSFFNISAFGETAETMGQFVKSVIALLHTSISFAGSLRVRG